MTILIVQNYSDSPPGLIADVFREQQADFVIAHPYAGEALPDAPGDYTGMVVLGGGQSAIADTEFPYLAGLAALTRQFGEADRPVMGVCLGAQLVARGFGGRNILGKPVEFGFQHIHPTPAAATDPLFDRLSGPTPIFHWHTDTFDLPDGAVHLARSAMTPHQAFRIGRATYGLQFHLEVTPEILDGWERIGGPYLDHKLPDWREQLTTQRAAYQQAAAKAGREMTQAWLELIKR